MILGVMGFILQPIKFRVLMGNGVITLRGAIGVQKVFSKYVTGI